LETCNSGGDLSSWTFKQGTLYAEALRLYHDLPVATDLLYLGFSLFHGRQTKNYPNRFPFGFGISPRISVRHHDRTIARSPVGIAHCPSVPISDPGYFLHRPWSNLSRNSCRWQRGFRYQTLRGSRQWL